uniref:DNA mismatch repair MutH/Type II restriction enzyme Sau3AI domain-containing protein n=1 Tax=Prevotella sp. GTC17259 TaxID=3236795 RepID=A0AB33J5G2_9BACT
MDNHIFKREVLEDKFEAIVDKTLGEIDDKGIFERVKQFPLQKGIAGTVIEQCVIGYAPDNKQDADLMVVYPNNRKVPTELKTTGMVLNKNKEYVAKEPMSITAVGIYDLVNQSFASSHFWKKIEHMLLVYYLYNSNNAVKAYEYKDFAIKGYDFHEFTKKESIVLQQDWENVWKLVKRIVDNHPGEHDKIWKEQVHKEYINVHGELHGKLNYIDLAPRNVPRFRFKKPFVSTLIAKKFGKKFSVLSEEYTFVSDIERKCYQLTKIYKGKTMRQIAIELNMEIPKEQIVNGGRLDIVEKADKAFGQKITVAMFGGQGSMKNIEIFNEFGIIGKTIILTFDDKRTEDMKFYRVDFDEMRQKNKYDEGGKERAVEFEDSEIYSYFMDQKFMIIIFKEPYKPCKGERIPLLDNIFVGFKLLTFSESFVYNSGKALWEDTRDKIFNNKLIDVIERDRNGNPKQNASGEVSSAPNWMKKGRGKDKNLLFFRGSGKISTMKYKTEVVNGIYMLPQNVWIDGEFIVQQLNLVDDLTKSVESR